MNPAFVTAFVTPKIASSTAPSDIQVPDWTKEQERKVNFAHYQVSPRQDVEIEFEYATKAFPLGGDQNLYASNPLRFAYVDNSGIVEILGWNLRVDLNEATDLPRQIARRFLQLFSQAQTGNLSEQDEACFDQICGQIDYRRFCAERDLPRYMEALVVRKSPGLIRYLGGANIRISNEVRDKIGLVDEGEYFGGYFTLDREGHIIDIQNVVFVASPEEVLAEVIPTDFRQLPGDFPDQLRGMLPKVNESDRFKE
ncbi:MAG: hypothetical protein R3F19_32955 [Verrucomicrobiales bacterium]